MAAAALLRSVARARAPPHPLARGLHDGARSGLPSLARKKTARAPPHGYHHRLLCKRGLHSSTSPNPGASGSTSTPPTSDKDLIENLPIRLSFSRALVSAFGAAAVYLSFWELPEDNSLTHAIKQLESTIDEHEENLQSSGHGEIKVDKSEVDRVLKFFPIMKEIADDIEDIQATSEAMQVTIKYHQAAAAELRAALESALTEGELEELLSAEKIEMVNQNMLELLLASELPALESALPEGERKGVAS